MTLSLKLHSPIKWAATLAVTLLSAGGAFAQDDHPAAAIAAASGILLFVLVFALAAYVYFALAIQTIAQKTNTENPWLAWIPIVNIVLLLNIAKKPIWWFLLFLIPLVNIVIAVIVWMGVAEARNKPSWWGILMIVPVVNLIVPAYLAWSD
jgi:Family of unknown function (DUF5684)